MMSFGIGERTIRKCEASRRSMKSVNVASLPADTGIRNRLRFSLAVDAGSKPPSASSCLLRSASSKSRKLRFDIAVWTIAPPCMNSQHARQPLLVQRHESVFPVVACGNVVAVMNRGIDPANALALQFLDQRFHHLRADPASVQMRRHIDVVQFRNKSADRRRNGIGHHADGGRFVLGISQPYKTKVAPPQE